LKSIRVEKIFFLKLKPLSISGTVFGTSEIVCKYCFQELKKFKSREKSLAAFFVFRPNLTLRFSSQMPQISANAVGKPIV